MAFLSRSRTQDEVKREYDVAIIGAGINGAAIAREAATRGLSVIVVDKADIGSGTSAWSSEATVAVVFEDFGSS